MFSTKVVIFLAIVAACYGAPNIKISNTPLGIAGGFDAKIEDYPFSVSVQSDYTSRLTHSCGGAIINERWVLTSASCVYMEPSRVIVGATDTNGDDRIAVNVAAGFPHSDSSEYNISANDIGLLYLTEPLTFNSKVQAAKLPTQGQKFSGKATFTSYGSDALRPNVVPIPLQKRTVTLVSNDECREAINAVVLNGGSKLDTNSNICTFDRLSNTCYGDMGSPLTQDGTIVGTASWYISPCGTFVAPDVYTGVSNFVNWIEETIKQHS